MSEAKAANNRWKALLMNTELHRITKQSLLLETTFHQAESAPHLWLHHKKSVLAHFCVHCLEIEVLLGAKKIESLERCMA